MTISFTPWRRTGETCKRGLPVERRTVEVAVLQATNYDTETETRCCVECEQED